MAFIGISGLLTTVEFDDPTDFPIGMEEIEPNSFGVLGTRKEPTEGQIFPRGQ